jgi:translation elongation factor EF-Tu-like GTPase
LDILSIQRDLADAEVKDLLHTLKQEADDRDVNLLSCLKSIERKIENQSSITVEDLDALKSSLNTENQSLVKLLENKFDSMDMLTLEEGIKEVQEGIHGIQHDVHDMKDLDRILNGEALEPKEQQSPRLWKIVS